MPERKPGQGFPAIVEHRIQKFIREQDQLQPDEHAEGVITRFDNGSIKIGKPVGENEPTTFPPREVFKQ